MPFDVDMKTSTNSRQTENTQDKVIDTSLLYRELRDQYRRSSETQVQADFRKLVSWVKLGNQHTHQIHPYPAKLLPNIANFFIRASCLRGKNDIVLDPFCGSGTVALEASLSGAIPFIADSNPLALLISKVKTTPYDTYELEADLEKILVQFSKTRTAPSISVVNHHLWYSDSRKRSLERLSRTILQIENEDRRSFFLVCFSALVRKLSHADPAISVPVRLKTKGIFSEARNRKIEDRLRWLDKASTKEEFKKISKANIDRVIQTNSQSPYRVSAKVVGSDARNLLILNSAIADNSIPIIITSPPYGSAQKYIRATSLSLNWLKFASPSELSALEGKSIGREHLPNFRKSNSESHLQLDFLELIRKIEKKNSLRANITERYLVELRSSLMEMARVLEYGGVAVLVIGNNQVCGETLRNDLFIIEVMEEFGLTLELNLIDHIKSRGLMTKRNKTASVISREVVLVFRK